MRLVESARAAWMLAERYEERFGTDDALAVEVLGMVLVAGVLVRTGVHVWIAILARKSGVDVSPRLAESDVSLASPVRDLDGNRRDIIARLATMSAGLGMAYLFTPVPGSLGGMGEAVVVANIAVVVLDPVWFLFRQLQKQITISDRLMIQNTILGRRTGTKSADAASEEVSD